MVRVREILRMAVVALTIIVVRFSREAYNQSLWVREICRLTTYNEMFVPFKTLVRIDLTCLCLQNKKRSSL